MLCPQQILSDRLLLDVNDRQNIALLIFYFIASMYYGQICKRKLHRKIHLLTNPPKIKSWNRHWPHKIVVKICMKLVMVL